MILEVVGRLAVQSSIRQAKNTVAVSLSIICFELSELEDGPTSTLIN